jgi:hypothetical protein
MTLTRPPSSDGYEMSDASPAVAGLIASVILAGLVVTIVVAGWIDHHYPSARSRRDPAESFQHGPAAKTGIERDWAEQDRVVCEHLATYGWINRPAGVVHIPIERAMAVIATEAVGPQPKEKQP